MSRLTQATATDGAITADVIQKALNNPNTDVGKASGVFDNPQAQFRVGPQLVKGTRRPGEKVLEDFDEISKRQRELESAYRASVTKSLSDPLGVIEGLSPMFGGPLGMMLKSSNWYQLNQLGQATMGKSFTTTSPLGSGVVPFDLQAPTWLLYSLQTPLRNRFPRVPGQGLSHRAKVMTSILGSQPGVFGNPTQRMSMSELPSGGSLTSWPNQLPPPGSQTMVDVNIPYKFFGLTEAVSWLSQFAGQGFDDIAALASLILLQEFTLGEERAIIGATQTALTAPTAATATARTAGTGETGLSGIVGSALYVYVTGVNYYGETTSVTSGSISATNGQVVDVTITGQAASAGTLGWNIYVATGTADPGRGGAHLMASGVGGTMYTLQGAVPTTGNTPPTADTGTSASTDYEGIFSILSGHAAANSSTTGYPSTYTAGYYNGAVGTQLTVLAVDNALRQVYNGSSSSYFADPSELWTSAADATNLSKDMVVNANGLNYTIFVNQDEVANAKAGIAVSQFVNPVTRSSMKITVHPYFPQGTAVGMSYSPPQAQQNINNVWENVMVQDYLSINWPVIDVTFRYSLFLFGTLFCAAPQYNFLLGGLQNSSTKPYS